MCVHGYVNTSDGSMNLGSVFEFDSHSLMTEFHQKPGNEESDGIMGKTIFAAASPDTTIFMMGY